MRFKVIYFIMFIMNEKICFSKRIGILVLALSLVGVSVFSLSNIVSTKSVTTQSRASVNCVQFECNVYGGDKYSGVAYLKKIKNVYLYYSSSNQTCSGTGSRGGWKSVCVKAGAAQNPTPTLDNLPECKTTSASWCVSETIQKMTGNYVRCNNTIVPNISPVIMRCCDLYKYTPPYCQY